MFLLRLPLQLLGMLFRLVLLPLRMLGILNLLWIPARILLRLFARNTVAFLVVLGLLFVFFYFRNNNASLPQLTPVPADSSQAKPADPSKIPIVQPVSKTEDGNSDFSSDLYAAMNKVERSEYSKHFYFAMAQKADGTEHAWSYYNIAGRLRPNDSFTNAYGDRCRHFSEVLKVQHIQQTVSGTACERGNGSWCKLRENATPVCGMGKSRGGTLDSISRSLGNLF